MLWGHFVHSNINASEYNIDFSIEKCSILLPPNKNKSKNNPNVYVTMTRNEEILTHRSRKPNYFYENEKQ